MVAFEKKGMEEKGVAHIVAAFGYSMSGARYLLSEEAARLELITMAIAIAILGFSGASIIQFAILMVLFLLVLCVESINTAIELVVDRVSPEISEFAKQTKDIASFAVFCSLAVFWGFVGLVAVSSFLL